MTSMHPRKPLALRDDSIAVNANRLNDYRQRFPLAGKSNSRNPGLRPEPAAPGAVWLLSPCTQIGSSVLSVQFHAAFEISQGSTLALRSSKPAGPYILFGTESVAAFL